MAAIRSKISQIPKLNLYTFILVMDPQGVGGDHPQASSKALLGGGVGDEGEKLWFLSVIFKLLDV